MPFNRKHYAKLFLSLLIINMGLLSAESRCCTPSTSEHNSIASHFSFFADYLYWNVCRPGEDLFQMPQGATQKIINFENDYQSGYRVGGAFTCSQWGIAARYTSFNPTLRRNVEFLQIFHRPTYTLDYSVVDIDLNYQHDFCSGRGYLKPFIGVKLAWIDESLDVEVNLNAKRTRNKFNGYGVNIGSDLFINLCDLCLPIAFVARGSIAILNGNFSANGAQIASGTLTTLDYDKRCAYVLVPNYYVGLNFGLPKCSCIAANLEIGYEAQLWNSWSAIQGQAAVGSPLELRTQGTLGLGGLVARLQIGF